MNNEEIKKIIHDLLHQAEFSVTEIAVDVDDDIEITRFTIDAENPQMLVGKRGEALRAINYIVRRFMEEKYGVENIPNILVDIGGYHKRKIEEIKTKARIVADRARSFKRDIELDPMSAYDRLIVHSFLSKTPDVETESMGEGRNRRVVIKHLDVQ